MNSMRAYKAWKGIIMEENKIIITDELLRNLSVDKLVSLKVEIDNLVNRLDNIEEACNNALDV